MAATIKDIAKETGLGLATISSYLNGGRVREKNRIKIEEAIRSLHYEVNETARGLKLGQTHTVGVVIPELKSRFCARVVSRMEDTLLKHGYAMIICDCRTDRERERQAVEFLSRKQVDALINMPVDEKGAHLSPILRSGRPVLLIDREIPFLDCDCVSSDNAGAIVQAVELLTGRGHRRIGMIAGGERIFSASERIRGFYEGLRAAGIPKRSCPVLSGRDTIEGGAGAVREMLKAAPDLSALVVASSDMTMGAMIGLNEMGILIPDQISVVGFDNRDFARACRPVLTIVDQPETDIADRAAELLLDRLSLDREAQGQIAPRRLQLQARVIEGSSIRLA